MQLSKYEIIEELGKGGFGIVYKARDLTLERDVALKVLHPQLAADAEFVERFRKEARSLAMLEHPNIVPIHEFTQVEGRYFIDMRYLGGGSLAKLINLKGGMNVEEFLRISRQVVAGLSYAHEKGLIHCDIKPNNILFDSFGNAMITDFGLTRAAQTSRSESTSIAIGGMGTPEYMAPEMWEMKAIAPTVDQYSLACVMCEMLTGKKLFEGETTPIIMMKHFKPLLLPDTIPSYLKPILQKALAIQPQERYQSLFEMQHDIEKAVANIDDGSEKDRQIHARLEKAKAMLAQGNLEAALTDLEALYKIAPELAAPLYIHALMTRGEQKFQAGKLEEALNDQRTARKISPAGKTTEAIELAIQKVENEMVTRNLKTAEDLLGQGQVDASILRLEEISHTSPKRACMLYGKALLERGRIKAQKGDFTGAKQDYEKGISLVPEGETRSKLNDGLEKLKMQDVTKKVEVENKRRKTKRILFWTLLLIFACVVGGIIFIQILEWRLGIQQEPIPEATLIPSTVTEDSIVSTAIGENTPITATKEESVISIPTQLPTAILEFTSLPEPQLKLINSGGTWQNYAGVNKATSMVMRDGVMWTASGGGGVVAWDPGSGEIKQYTVNDGLSSNSISSLVLSNDNTLWAGTWEVGISRFDGSDWTIIDSPGLSQLVPHTRDGSIWAYSPYNAFLGFYHDGMWEIFSEGDGLPTGAAYIIDVVSDPSGGIWILTEDDNYSITLSSYKNEYWNYYTSINGLPEEYYNLMGVSSKSEVWLLDSYSNILQFDGANCQIITSLQGSIWNLSSFVTPNDNLLLSYSKNSDIPQGLAILDGENIHYYSVDDGLPTNDIYGVYVDPEGKMWVSTPDGLAKQETNGSWHTFMIPGKISSGEVEDIMVSFDGSLWVASHGGGINYFDGTTWHNYSTRNGLVSDYFWNITKSKDRTIWFGSWNNGSIMSFGGSAWETYGIEQGLESTYIWSITAAEDGTIWAGTDNGVASFRGDRWQMYTPVNDSALNDVRSIVTDENGNVWIGTYEGKVVRFNNGNWQVYDSGDGLPAETPVMALEINLEGILFAGTYDGLFRMINDRWEAVRQSPGYVNDIAFADDGSLWIATEFEGITKFDRKLEKQENYQLGQGLAGLRMQAIAVGQDGAIWVGGEGGLVKFTPNQ